MGLTMSHLETCFNNAIVTGAAYIGVAFALPDHPGREVIINGSENFQQKLAYYKKTYGDDLQHRFAAGVRIVGVTYGNSFEEIQKNLLA